jgi:alpha-mannosidase
VPSQRLSTGELAVMVDNVAPFSGKRLFVERGAAYAKSGVNLRGNTLENEFLTVSVNPQTGAIDNLTAKENDAQLVDKTRGAGLNQYLYVSGMDSAKAQGLSNVRVRVKEQGPLVASLLVEADAPGERRYSSEVRIYAGIDRVDLITNFDKKAVREKEGVHIAFPFSVPGGELRYDVADGIVRPETDQLAGACKNFSSVESWVDVSNREYGVTWATTNAPLIEIGSITAEQPWMKSLPPSTAVYSYVMNNYWHTNYKADQEGPVSFAYSILPHAAFNSAEAARFGVERRQPLIATVADPSTEPPASLLRLSSPDVMVSSLKPTADGKSWLVYLYNPTDKTQKVNFQSKAGLAIPSRASDAGGSPGAESRDFGMAAFGSTYRLVTAKP